MTFEVNLGLVVAAVVSLATAGCCFSPMSEGPTSTGSTGGAMSSVGTSSGNLDTTSRTTASSTTTTTTSATTTVGTSVGGSSTGGTAGCIPLPSGAISWWTGNDTAADLLGNNPGTWSGNTSYQQGMVGKAFSFDGASDVFTGTNLIPSGSSDRTIELWGQLASTDVPSYFIEQTFVEYGQFGNNGAAYTLLGGGDHYTGPGIALEFTQWGSEFNSPSPIIQGLWHHLAVTSASGFDTLYIDGVNVASQTLTFDTPPSTTLYIGGLGMGPDGRTDRLTGLADEVTIYDRALAAQEIAEIYQAGSAGKCPPGG